MSSTQELPQMSTTQVRAPRLVRIAEVLSRLGCSQATLYSLMQKGEFPRPILLGSRCAVWPDQQVDAWIVEKIESAAAKKKS